MFFFLHRDPDFENDYARSSFKTEKQMCKNVFLDDDREGTVLTKYVTNIRVIAGNVMAYI